MRVPARLSLDAREWLIGVADALTSRTMQPMQSNELWRDA
jgi:hypothetical protein